MRLQGIIRKIKQNGEQKVVNETVLRMLMEFQEYFLSASSKVASINLIFNNQVLDIQLDTIAQTGNKETILLER